MAYSDAHTKTFHGVIVISFLDSLIFDDSLWMCNYTADMSILICPAKPEKEPHENF